MNSFILGRCALSVCAAATLLVGCGGLQPAGVTQGPVPQGQMPENPSRVSGVRQPPRSVRHASVTETVLHSFGKPYDGRYPESGLTYFKGTFYGTTAGGGASVCRGGCGTVYRITTSGQEKVLHRFGLVAGDGNTPYSRVIVLNGTLYGTTLVGGSKGKGQEFLCSFSGAAGFGTVFSITPSGQETVLHAFRSSEGRYPLAALLNVNGTMYGTTCGGGVGSNGGDGTVFTITPSGDEHAIYSFQGPGGALPGYGRLADLNGTLYGTTQEGGNYGQGAVFSLSTSGTEKVLHSFHYQPRGSIKDGVIPDGGLVAIKDTLYGTTASGGTGTLCGRYGCGTVFSITPSGTETVLYNFNRRDGWDPEATLLNVNGTLYGTTYYGGAHGNGEVFSITPSGHETVLYSFGGAQGGGGDPRSGLVYVNGTFYGTTVAGGAYGNGTVYSIKL